MRTLDPAAKPSAILSFDFDGTLHNPASEPPVPPEFFELIRVLRQKYGVVWGINTGRSMPQMMEGFIESRFPFIPDYVVAREREIFFPNNFGRWIPDAKWNKACEKEIAKLFKSVRKLLATIRSEIEDHTGAHWIEMAGEPAGIVAQSDEEMEWIVKRVEELTAKEPRLGWQRNSIYLRFGHKDYQKGSSLAEVARRYSLGVECRFAIGDSHNDFEMLDPKYAAMTACPANAVYAIKQKIVATGGYQAGGSQGFGAMEALLHFF